MAPINENNNLTANWVGNRFNYYLNKKIGYLQRRTLFTNVAFDDKLELYDSY